jgi:hypothetical protein
VTVTDLKMTEAQNSAALLVAEASPALAELCFRDSVRQECEAAMQLLAERAAFLTAATSVSIALEQKGSFLCYAATGEASNDAGMVVDATREPVHNCLQTQQAVRAASNGDSGPFILAVPVSRNGLVAGFLELVSPYEFQAGDVLRPVRPFRYSGMLRKLPPHPNLRTRAQRISHYRRSRKWDFVCLVASRFLRGGPCAWNASASPARLSPRRSPYSPLQNLKAGLAFTATPLPRCWLLPWLRQSSSGLSANSHFIITALPHPAEMT